MGTIKQQAVQQMMRLATYHWVMFIISLIAVILGFTVSYYWFIVLVLPLVLTPVARETGLVGDGSPKVEYIAYQGSYVAFYLTLLVLAAVLVGRWVSTRGSLGEPEERIFLVLFLIPLLYKFFSALALTYGARTVGLFLGYILGALMLLATLIRFRGVSPELIIAILAIVVCIISNFAGKLGGALLALVGTAYFVTLVDRWNEIPNAFWLSLLLASPLILAGLLVFFHRRIEVE